MVISAILLFFVALAAALVWKRRPLAEMQSLMGGGRVAPGCFVAQALFVLLLAAIGLWMHQHGWLTP